MQKPLWVSCEMHIISLSGGTVFWCPTYIRIMCMNTNIVKGKTWFTDFSFLFGLTDDHESLTGECTKGSIAKGSDDWYIIGIL